MISIYVRHLKHFQDSKHVNAASYNTLDDNYNFI